MTSDLPPAYTALMRHPMMPRTSHDEAARFNFLTHFNRYVSGTLGRGNQLAYDARVLPAFRAGGPGGQTRMNAVLRDWLKTQSPV